MRSRERIVWSIVCLVLVVALAGVSARKPRAASDTVVRPRPEPRVKMSMAALHEQGGTPLGWSESLFVVALREVDGALGEAVAPGLVGEDSLGEGRVVER